MRFWPRSLRGQVLLAVLAALLVAQLAGLVASDLARAHLVRQIRIMQAVDAAGALVIELDQTAPRDRRPLLRAAGSPLTRHHLDDRPLVAVSDARLAGFLDRLEGALGAPATEQPRIRLETAPAPPAPPTDVEPPESGLSAREAEFRRRAALRRPSGDMLMLSLPLADGQWLNSTLRFPGPNPALRAQANLTLVLSALAIAAVLWVVLARVLRPLRGLASAAEALGRGEARQLPVTGPAEMRALTRAFNDMQDRLHRLVNDRTQMLAALGHDLRSPLTALRLRVEMLEDDEDRARMNASLDEMQDMVEQTLTWARGVWSAEPVADLDLGALLAELADEARAGGCMVALAAPAAPVRLRARPVALRRALRNLIDNGCRYGGRVEIGLERRRDAVRITLRDHGPGIPEDRLAQVLDPFVRVEASRSRETGGTGLGLAIAQGVAQAHGGALALANHPEGGLEAVLTLPLPQPAGA